MPGPTSADTIHRLTLDVLTVTGKTKWAFVEVETIGGATGVGEATLNGEEKALAAALHALGPGLIGRSAVAGTLDGLIDPRDLPRAAIVSALDQALHDLESKRRGVTLAAMLGQQRSTIGLYANINRRTLARTPEAFANSARLALDAGFRAVKMAPFDEVQPQTATLQLATAGLARIAAVKSVLPDGLALYVDCHWRFTPSVATELVAPLRERGVSWFECPIAET